MNRIITQLPMTLTEVDVLSEVYSTVGTVQELEILDVCGKVAIVRYVPVGCDDPVLPFVIGASDHYQSAVKNLERVIMYYVENYNKPRKKLFNLKWWKEQMIGARIRLELCAIGLQISNDEAVFLATWIARITGDMSWHTK